MDGRLSRTGTMSTVAAKQTSHGRFNDLSDNFIP